MTRSQVLISKFTVSSQPIRKEIVSSMYNKEYYWILLNYHQVDYLILSNPKSSTYFLPDLVKLSS